MHIIYVVGGQNIFPCMEYLDSIAAACRQYPYHRCHQRPYQLTDKQQKEFGCFTNETGFTDVSHFNLSKDRNLTTQQKINDVMKDGIGLGKCKRFYKDHFR